MHQQACLEIVTPPLDAPLPTQNVHLRDDRSRVPLPSCDYNRCSLLTFVGSICYSCHYATGCKSSCQACESHADARRLKDPTTWAEGVSSSCCRSCLSRRRRPQHPGLRTGFRSPHWPQRGRAPEEERLLVAKRRLCGHRRS